MRLPIGPEDDAGGAADLRCGGPRPRLLVVDDQPLNIQALQHAFSADHDVDSATDGETALALCRSRPPDLVLLDVSMPGLDGYQVCERLKADVATRDIPVIFVTAEPGSAAAVRALAVGAADLIAKPFSPVLARARVRTHLQLRRQAEQLRLLAGTDALTGLPDRRAFDARLKSELRLARRRETRLSLLLIDVDRLASYNAMLGHPAGDDCLRLIAAGLRSRLQRHGDSLARVGGPMFACLLPDTPESGATLLAEVLRERVRDLDIAHPDAGAGAVGACTISIGAATCRPQLKGSCQDLLARATAALRAAKAAGGNQVSTSVPDACACCLRVDAAQATA